jgi:hypothetical protein
VDGLVAVDGYNNAGRLPEEVATMEKAAHYGADAVFFEASRDGKPPVAQAFIYRSDGPAKDPDFAKRHQQLWSWGGVPLVYRVTNGLVQLFRCAHRPDFEKDGEIVFKPFKTLKDAARIRGSLEKARPQDSRPVCGGAEMGLRRRFHRRNQREAIRWNSHYRAGID